MMKIFSRLLIIVFGFFILSSEAMAQDPVPNFLKELKKYPGLETAVTGMVFDNPFGRIHGHDAERIELSMNNNSTLAIIVFVMPDSFVLHNDGIDLNDDFELIDLPEQNGRVAKLIVKKYPSCPMDIFGK
jgi:hypothetical protein